MPQQMILDIQTEYNGQGLKMAKDDMQGFEAATKGANAATDGVSLNYEGLLKKMERPLGRQTFHLLAADALMGSEAMGKASSATGPLAAGFHALGNAAMFASPEIAGIAILLMGLVAIYQKVTEASGGGAEAQRKHADALVKDSQAAKDAAESLKTLGTITEAQYKALKSSGADKDTELRKMATKIELEKKDIDSQVDLANREVIRRGDWAQGLGLVDKLNHLQEKQNNLQESQIIIGQALSGQSKSRTDEENKALTMKIRHAEAIEKMNAPMMTYITAQQRINDLMDANLALEAKYEKSTPEEQAAIQQRIDANKALITVDEEAIRKHDQIAKAEEAVLKKRASTYDKYLSQISDSVEVHGKAVVFNGRKFLGEELKDAANQAATYLEIQAAKYFASGNYGMGAAALAAAEAVKALASAGAAALDAGGNTDTGSSGSSAASASPAMDTPSSQTNNMNLQIVLEGHTDVTQMLDMLIKNVNARVQSGGVNLVSTSVLQSGGRFQPV